MQLEDLRPDDVEDATLAEFEALGLPQDVMDAIRERGVQFKWDSKAKRYVAEIPKRKPISHRMRSV